MSAAYRRTLIQNHPNRSRLEAAEKKAAIPPTFHGPQDLDNPLSFLAAYDHVSPAMRMTTSLNLPTYNKMVLTPSEQAKLQEALGDMKNLLLNRVLSPAQSRAREKLPAQDVPSKGASSDEILIEGASGEETQANDDIPGVFTQDFRTKLDGMANKSGLSEKAKGKQPQASSWHIDLDSLPKNDRFEIADNSLATAILRARYAGRKRGIDGIDPDDAGPGPSSTVRAPKSKVRCVYGLGIADTISGPSRPAASNRDVSDDEDALLHNATTSKPVEEEANGSPDSGVTGVTPPVNPFAPRSNPFAQPVNPFAPSPFAALKGRKGVNPFHRPTEDELFQQAADDALTGDLSVNRPRRGGKVADPAYRYSKPDQEQEAIDDALRPDFDDITPSKPVKIVDPTFRPSQDDDDADEDSPIKTTHPKKKFAKLQTQKIFTCNDGTDKNGASANTPANTPVAKSRAKKIPVSVLAKKSYKSRILPPKESIPEPVVIESDPDSYSDFDSLFGSEDDVSLEKATSEAPIEHDPESEKAIVPKKAVPAKKPAANKSTPAKENTAPKKLAPKPADEPEPESESESKEQQRTAKKPTPQKAQAKKAAPAKTTPVKRTPEPKNTTPKNLAAETKAPVRRTSHRLRK